MPNPKKTAVLLTGAAARVSQEVAILDKLMEKKGLVLSPSETLLAGFSSGSLNIAAINACFADNSPLGWDQYYKQQILFPLKNEDVFKPKMLPFSTKPLLKKLVGLLHDMGAKWMGDLPFLSYVTVFARTRLKTEWACSQYKGNKNLKLSGLLMASAAIPVLFPARRIKGKYFKKRNFPRGRFNDGGTGGTFKHFEECLGTYVKENGAFEKMYIISPQREVKHEERLELVDEVRALAGERLDLDIMKGFFGKVSMHSFMEFLLKLQEWNQENGHMARDIFVSIPGMDKNFGILDFNKEQQEHAAVCKWFDDNPGKLAVPLDDYIQANKEVMY